MNINSKKRNYLLILILFGIYFCTYFLKYSYNANIINIEQRFAVPHNETGLVSSLFFAAYGIGQFINGIFVKRYNLKFVIPFAIVISSILNVALMITPTDMFYLVKYYWLINGACLSVLYPCVIRFYAENANEKFKSKGAFAFGICTAIGTSLAYALSALFTKINNFLIIYIFGASLGIALVIIWFVFYKKLIISNDEIEIKNDSKIETTKITKSFVIYATLCGLICACMCFARDGTQNWAPTILNESFSFDKSSSLLLTVLLPLGQFFGVLLATTLSKRIKSHMFQCIIYALVGSIFIALGWIFNFDNKYMTIIMMVFTIILSSAICQVIVGILPIAWSKERNSGLFAGLFNGCAYIGAAIATYGLTFAAEDGWNNVFKIIGIVYFAITIVIIAYYLIRKYLRYKGHNIK